VILEALRAAVRVVVEAYARRAARRRAVARQAERDRLAQIARERAYQAQSASAARRGRDTLGR
jgi:hypothetical protein